jgi:hypothetical protein
LHRAAIRLHQPTGPELRPAIVPRDDGYDIAHTAMLKHRQHRPPGRPVWLTVIAHTDTIGAPRRADDKGPAVVGRIGKLLADRFHKVLRGFNGWRRPYRADKSTAVDDLFSAVRGRRYRVPW